MRWLEISIKCIKYSEVAIYNPRKFTCLKLTIETLEKGVKYALS